VRTLGTTGKLKIVKVLVVVKGTRNMRTITKRYSFGSGAVLVVADAPISLVFSLFSLLLKKIIICT
jgi:hypothetical protein